MGATVTTNRKVAAFRRANGEVIYVLFEETYEKNVRPHKPDWGVRGIGTFDDVMLRIFQGAASCEGGMLQTRAGHTTPEAHLQSWAREFKAPLMMPDKEFTLTLGGNSMYSPIGSEHEEEAVRALQKIGREDLLEAMRAGPVQVQLHADIDIIIAIYGVNTNIPLWKILRDDPPYHHPINEALAPPMRDDKIVIPTVQASRLNKENLVVSVGGAAYENMGWAYAAVGKFIREVALPIELRCTGAGKKMIGAFRDKLNAAEFLPGQTVITIKPAATEYPHYLSQAQSLAIKLGKATSKEDVPETFQVTFAEVEEAGEQYLLSSLQTTQTAWSVPVEVEDASATFPTILPVLHAEQVSLF